MEINRTILFRRRAVELPWVARVGLAVMVLVGVAASQGRVSMIRDIQRPTIPTIPPYKAQVLGTALEQPIDPAAYVVGPGDVFLISVIGIDPYLVQATVTPSGMLIIPQIGSLEVRSHTAAWVTTNVLALIKRVYPTYESNCILYGIREMRISVAGAVANPAYYRVTPQTRLSDLLTLAGGWKSNGALHRIELANREGPIRTVDLTRYFHKGDITQNPFLNEGDQVVVPYSDISREMISVRGLAAVPAYYAIGPDESVATFLDRWYASSSKAEISGVELHRIGAQGQPLIQHLRAVDYATAELHAGDILYVDTVPGVNVLGEVKNPGRYEYQPGLTAEDYVAYAVGRTSEGSRSKVRVTRSDGQVVRGRDTEIRPGDVIRIPRSARSVMVGGMGLVQVALAVLNLYLIASR